MLIIVNCNVIGNNESIKCHCHGCLFIIRLICIPAGIMCNILGSPEGIHSHAKAFRKLFSRERLRPFRRIGACICPEIVVKIPPADHVVSTRIVRFHIGKQHTELAAPYLFTASISRQMYIIKAEHLSVIHRYPRNGIAPVQIGKLTESSRNRQASANRIRDFSSRIGDQSGLVRPMRFPWRHHQIRRIIILCKGIIISCHKLIEQIQLIHMVGTRPVNIHFLQENKVCRSIIDDIPYTTDIRNDTLFIFRSGILSSIHKETVIPLISSKPDVVGHNPIRFPCRNGSPVLKLCIFSRLGNGQWLVIRQPVICHHDINHVANTHRQQYSQQNSDSSQYFLQNASVLPIKHITIQNHINHAGCPYEHRHSTFTLS